MTDPDIKTRIEEINRKMRPVLDRFVHGPYPLEQQCPHELMRSWRRARAAFALRYLCRRCHGYYDQTWEPFFAGLSLDDIDRYVASTTGSTVLPRPPVGYYCDICGDRLDADGRCPNSPRRLD